MISTKTIKKLTNYINGNSFKLVTVDNLQIFLNTVTEAINAENKVNGIVGKQETTAITATATTNISLAKLVNMFIDEERDLDNVFTEMLQRINKTAKYETIDCSFHVSAISKYICDNSYVVNDDSVIEEFTEQHVIYPDISINSIKSTNIYAIDANETTETIDANETTETIDANETTETIDANETTANEFFNKYAIRNLKRSHNNYALFYGHFMESIVGNLLVIAVQSRCYSANSSTKSSVNYSVNELIEIAVKDTEEEVKTKSLQRIDDAAERSKLINDVTDFRKDITANHNIFEIFIEELQNTIHNFIEDIEKRTNAKLIDVIRKVNYTYRGVNAEADYLFVMKNAATQLSAASMLNVTTEITNSSNYNDAATQSSTQLSTATENNRFYILVDCKNYERINSKTIEKFLYQLIGYYQQHKILQINPIKKQQFPYEIQQFCIINPLDGNNDFSYYLYNCDDALDDYIEIYENYLDKCFKTAYED